MGTPERGGELSLPRIALQICLVAAAFYWWTHPFIQPIKLMVVLLHEMSHGLMALASGGTVHSILITPDEGGACRSEGGNAILVASAGYLGSIFFGGMILRSARGGGAVPAIYALLTLLVLGAAVTVLQDPYSRTFALSLAGSFIFLGLIAPGFIGAIVLRGIGTVSCLYAIFDIYSDTLTARSDILVNDAEVFASLTGIPSQFVGMAWLAVSVAFFISILKASLAEMPPPARAKEVAAG